MSAAAPRYARPFVAVFLAALVVCALVPLNFWPFSNWELFSRLRRDEQTGWAAVAVDRTGRERVYPATSLPHGYRGFAAVLAGFSERSAAVRDAICADWLYDATERFGTGTRLVRIYRLEWELFDRHGNREAPRHRTMEWVCSTKGASETG